MSFLVPFSWMHLSIRGISRSILQGIEFMVDESAETTQDVEIPMSIPGFRTGCRIFMHLVSNYTVTGRHHIPQDGSYILISNHMSFFDAPAMGAALTGQIAGFAAKKYKNHPLLRIAFAAGAPVWIEQEAPDRRALQHGLKIIKAGHPFVLSPEGTRSPTCSLIEGKEGAAFLATRTRVPILPGVIWGTERIFRSVRPKVNIVFGKPFFLPEGRVKGDMLRDYTDRMMCAIAALLPEKYHGFYAGNPLIEEMATLVRE